ncbi:Outer membrane protein assembly factor BamB precursor [Bremerella volcania]|uniref:Outer membrane protein assembly factor BamB n=1 Tax=Bremerella volcania TaxID=2527984 RepID=A0A518CC27_9BACT|nr:PQQ-binding-like beta-propeller repeat protein [Bremerella volcania]QDU76782.1 Outer membrane protein assembly factor BamB precursor [Bremerella volcania]
MKPSRLIGFPLSRFSRSLLLLAFVLLSGTCFAGNVAAQSNWHQFRGPTGQGIAEGVTLPTEWGPDKNIAWKQEVPGLGWSSPVVAGDRIFLTTAVAQSEDKKADHSLRTLCLAADTGKIVWDVEVFLQDGETAPRIHGKNSHASPTPYLEGEMVYVHFGHMGTACLRQKDGSIVWSTQELTYRPTHGNGGSPVIWGDHLIFSIDGSDMQAVIALDKTTGDVAWKTERNVPDIPKYFSFSTPLLIGVDGKTQLISAGSGVVMAVDPSNGKEIWRVGYGKGYSVVPRPIFANGLVYVCTGYDRATLMAMRPDGQGDVTDSHVAFVVDRNVPLNPSLVAVGTSVYIISDNGILSCLDGLTGDVVWKERVGGNFSSSLLYAGGLIYLLDEAGKSTVVRPGDEYVVVAENDLGERALASLGVDGNDILLRTEKALYRVSDGK